ncbi:hypothetical protein PV392_30940 [Streptomyces sp. ME03-5709C]|nr:hypothetical protein [Streptomyces sp. ME03-5709C]
MPVSPSSPELLEDVRPAHRDERRVEERHCERHMGLIAEADRHRPPRRRPSHDRDRFLCAAPRACSSVWQVTFR